MKQVLAAVGCALLAVAVPDVASATSAAKGPQATAPRVVPYFSDVPISASTPTPNEKVTLYVKTARHAYQAVKTATSDVSGHATFHLRPAYDFDYYVSVGSTNSLPKATRIVQAACTASRKAAFANPIPDHHGSQASVGERYVALTANRGALWAGYAFNDYYPLEFDAISWRPGQHTATVLDRYNLGSGSYSPNERGTVFIAGITPAGAVVATVPSHRTKKPIVVAWSNGRELTLSHSSTWTSAQATGVSDAGQIVGVAHAGKHLYVITWSSPTARYRILTSAGSDAGPPAVDSRGDIAYPVEAGTTRVRLASGRTVYLVDSHAEPAIVSEVAYASGTTFYGLTAQGVAAFDTTKVTSAGLPVSQLLAPRIGAYEYGHQQDLNVVAAGPRGDIVLTDRGDHLRTVGGAYVDVPAQLTSAAHPGEAVDAHGAVAFTADDGLVHFLRCR